jgi:YD repeat-containing protein
MNDFSDDVLEQPNTAMVIEPGVPPDTPYADELVNGDASIPPPQAPYAPDLPETVGNYEGPVGVTGIFNGNVTTGCSYDPLSHSAHRAIDDIVVPGSIGKYPLKMTRYYNTRQQYYALTAIGLSPGWSHEYSWLVWAAGHKLVSPHGNVYDDYCGSPEGVSESWEGARPQPSPTASPGTGTWRLADGGRVHFDNWRVTYIDDPYGLRTRIAYNQSGSQAGQLVKVTEPGGRCLWFIYGDQNQGTYQGIAWGDGTWLLTRVEAYDVDGSPGTPNHPTGHLIDSVNYTYHVYDPITPAIPRRKQKMLWQVAYSDGTSSATYDYRTDNVHEGGATNKWYPLLLSCDDVRYNGPMRTIVYDYQPHFAHGFIADEKYPNVGAVSTITPTGPDTFTETRGDGPNGQGPIRRLTYTHFTHCVGDDCDDFCTLINGESEPHTRMLTDYTDFRSHTTHLGYDSNWYVNSVTDANTHTTLYARGSPPPNGIGEIRTITHPDQSYIHYDYETETEPNAIQGHYLHTIRDENAHVTTLTRDGHYRITWIDYPSDGNTLPSHEEFQYNGFGQVTRHRLKNGAYVHYGYDSQGRGLLIDKWEPTWNTTASESDPHTHYDYYTSGPWTDRVRTVTMPANWLNYVATETYEYDNDTSNPPNPVAGRGLVTKITHADGKYQSFAYSQFGNKLDEWNELFEHTHYVYDNYNRVLRVIRAGETTRYTYNPTNGGGSPYLHTTNNPDTITSPTNIVTTNVYDQNFRKTSTSVSGRTTWFDYDPVGNQTCVTDPRGTGPCSSGYTTTTQYDTRNRKWYVDDAQGNRTTFNYDQASNVLRIDRPNGNWEAKTYDAVNRVRDDTVSFTSGNPSVSLTTWFTYNPSGTIWKVTDARGSGRGDANYTTTFQYDDPSDQRTGMTYPPVNGHSDTQSWAYDDAHNLKWHITVAGAYQYFGYDQRNRYYDKLWQNFQGDWRWYYLTLDDASRVRRAQNGTEAFFSNTISDVHRNYDHLGRITLDRQHVTGLEAKDVNYEYDSSLRGAEGKPTRMYVNPPPNVGYDYDFRYDDMGRFEKILAHSGPLKFQYYYDNASNETQRHNDMNAVDQFYNPDPLNRPTTMDLRYNGATALESYGYYENGRLHTVTRGNKQDRFGYYLDGELYWVMYGVPQTDGVSGDTPPAEDPSKEKTPEDFLSLSGWDPNQALTADRSVYYNLDNAGNRNSVNDSGPNGFTAYQPNNLNQYTNQVGSDSITNGADHEVASYKTVSYTYKDEHLTNVSSGTNGYDLAYDALGRCVKRTVNGVDKYYIYDGERPILEYKASGGLAGKNLYGKGIDEILMRYDPTLTQGRTHFTTNRIMKAA